MATARNSTTQYKSRRVQFSPHVAALPGLWPCLRRLRHRLARRRARAYRLDQRRTTHPAGSTPARKDRPPEEIELSLRELRAIARYRAMTPLQKRLLWAGLRHRRIANVCADLITRLDRDERDQ